jgi:hypothetical protein
MMYDDIRTLHLTFRVSYTLRTSGLVTTTRAILVRIRIQDILVVELNT